MTLWIDSNNILHDDMDGAALSLPSWPQGMTQATQAQIDAILNPTPTAAQLHIALVALARGQLARSDTTILRCAENSIAVPPAWASYRLALRKIIDGTDTTSAAVPATPPYPAGT